MKVKATYTHAQMQRERRETVEDAMAFMTHIAVWCLHDEFGFGKERLERYLKWTEEYAREYMGEDGEVSLTDVHNMLLSECGINIHFNRARMR